MRSISASSIRSFCECREKYRLQDVDGWRAIGETEAQSLGKILHAGLEPFWRHDETDGPSAMLAAASSHPDYTRLDPYAQALHRALLVGYHLFWKDQHPYGPAKTETKFGSVREGYYLSGIIDASVGTDTLVEHKTTTQDITPGSLYWAKLSADFQVGMYFEAASALGLKPSVMCYDVIRKPDVEPKRATPIEERKYTKATAKEPSRLYANQRETDESVDEYMARVIAKMSEDPTRYFVRQEIVRLDHERERAAREIDSLARDMLRVVQDEPQPRTGVANGACVRCDFVEPCLFGAEMRPDKFVRRVR